MNGASGIFGVQKYGFDFRWAVIRQGFRTPPRDEIRLFGRFG